MPQWTPAGMKLNLKNWIHFREKIAKEKAAIHRTTNDCKLRALFKREPPPFTVNIHDGPCTQDELSSWAKQEISSTEVLLGDELYGLYLDSWRRAAQPLMLQECKVALENGCRMEDITQVLDSPTYSVMKADILVELRKQNSWICNVTSLCFQKKKKKSMYTEHNSLIILWSSTKAEHCKEVNKNVEEK